MTSDAPRRPRESIQERSATIRAARLSDAGALAGLLGELDAATDEAQVRERMDRMDAIRDLILVAVIGQVAVATASLHLVPQLNRDAPQAIVSSVVVSDAFRGRGIGTLLIRAIEAEALARGANRIELISGARRDRAHVFYERLGYQETSTHARRYVRMLDLIRS